MIRKLPWLAWDFDGNGMAGFDPMPPKGRALALGLMQAKVSILSRGGTTAANVLEAS
jgi:hypothetical protein